MILAGIKTHKADRGKALENKKSYKGRKQRARKVPTRRGFFQLVSRVEIRVNQVSVRTFQVMITPLYHPARRGCRLRPLCSELNTSILISCRRSWLFRGSHFGIALNKSGTLLCEGRELSIPLRRGPTCIHANYWAVMIILQISCYAKKIILQGEKIFAGYYLEKIQGEKERRFHDR